MAALDALEHGEAAPTTVGYLFDSRLSLESLQNWQSEFLSTAVLVVLPIFLHQPESPESSLSLPPDGQTGA